jgi:hypothetical protein
MHHVEADARGRACLVRELDRDGGVMDFGRVEPEGRGHDVQRSRDPSGVDEDHGAAVGRRVIERGDARRPAEALGTDAHRCLVAAEVDILAREWRLSCERRHAALVERCPEVHGLTTNEDELALEVRDLREDRPDVDVREVRHSSGFVPRRLTRAFGNVK